VPIVITDSLSNAERDKATRRRCRHRRCLAAGVGERDFDVGNFGVSQVDEPVKDFVDLPLDLRDSGTVAVADLAALSASFVRLALSAARQLYFALPSTSLISSGVRA